MSDIMDEFEFKPLTEGLGFHKKKEVKAEAPASLDFAPTEIPAPPARKPTHGFADLTTPLPRTGPAARKDSNPVPNKKNSPSAPPTTTVDDILKTLQEKKRPDFVSPAPKTKIDSTPEPQKYRKTTWDFSAFLLDFMLVLASNLLCLIIVLLTTKVDLFSNLFNPDSSGMIYLSLLALVAATSWIYLVVNRVFIGCTPGEWVFDQRLGLPEDMGSALYTLKTVLRATLVMATGLVILPLISAVTNKDILGQWLDLELYKKV